MRLVDLLAALDERQFASLCERSGVSLDRSKRRPPLEQAAHALARPGSLRQARQWPEGLRNAARALAASPEGIPRESVGGAAVQLVDAGLAFIHPEHPERLVMPGAYRVQVPPVEGDDPRSARVLLARLDDETLHAMASYHLHGAGHRLQGPRERLLGELLELVQSPGHIAHELSALAPETTRLLSAIEARGGELETDELLELERHPSRYAGAQLPRRSLSWELVRRGLLLPFAHGLWAVPTEVADVVGRDRRRAAERVRQEVVERVGSVDLLPSHAELASDPGPVAVALLGRLRHAGVRLRPHTGAPRSPVRRAARELALAPEWAEMLIALARAAGLTTVAIPLEDVGPVLFSQWRRSSAWDEAREPADAHRAPERTTAIATPTAPLREALLELLALLSPRTFAPVEDVVRATLVDLRASAAPRLIERARRLDAEAFPHDPEAILRRMLDVSLPALGVIDRGRAEEGALVRLSSRARQWLEQEASSSEGREARGAGVEAQWIGQGRLRVDSREPVPRVLEAAEAADVFASEGQLLLQIDSGSMQRALERGVDPDALEPSVRRLAGGVLDGESERVLRQARAARVECSLMGASGFLWVPDADLRRGLLEDRDGKELFVDPGPGAEGLIVRPGVSQQRLGRVLRRCGGAIHVSQDRDS